MVSLLLLIVSAAVSSTGGFALPRAPQATSTAPASLPTLPVAASSLISHPLCVCYGDLTLVRFLDSGPPSGLNAPQPIKTGLDRPAAREPSARVGEAMTPKLAESKVALKSN
ncbi:hypothetical protein B0H13DRAFT_2317552 [Mycena leptocephala]|nr:hypothetical protein B0H13DRAFT_2317552 [Mycena leptocephala]